VEAYWLGVDWKGCSRHSSVILTVCGLELRRRVRVEEEESMRALFGSKSSKARIIFQG
jgi:hypothetical protein